MASIPGTLTDTIKELEDYIPISVIIETVEKYFGKKKKDEFDEVLRYRLLKIVSFSTISG